MTFPGRSFDAFSSEQDVETALQHYSVEPYSKLGSGGLFMLGLDDVEEHRKQRAEAARAIYYDNETLRRCAEAAFQRVLIQFLSTPDFDLCELAEQVAWLASSSLMRRPRKRSATLPAASRTTTRSRPTHWR